jgi:hypothetical protein
MNRKQQLKKKSPYKGTGRYLQYVRCPCCGKLGRAAAMGHAGEHQLSVSQCIRKLPGWHTGWEWRHSFPDNIMLERLLEALRRATAQVEAALNRVKFDEEAWVGMMGKSKLIEKSYVGVSHDKAEGSERAGVYRNEVEGSERAHIGGTVSSRSV